MYKSCEDTEKWLLGRRLDFPPPPFQLQGKKPRLIFYFTNLLLKDSIEACKIQDLHTNSLIQKL